jgi:translation initiation factor eIF-2B subunit epsilon
MFGLITDIHQCLLPLANTPLIEYTLEFLAMSGVSEIYIYCGAHTAQVEDYILTSRWKPGSYTSPFTTLEILKSSATSVGDAMRDIDNRGLITGDFLLVPGDVVSNLPIDAALQRHRARRIADKNAIMTVVLRAAGTGPHRTKAQGIKPCFITNPKKSRILQYEEMNPLDPHKYVDIDPDILKENRTIDIRSDLIDCGIDICTPDVLALWSESFDYNTPRKDFLHGVLKDYELNGKTIHTEIIDQHYAARASNLQSYDAVTKDVMGRWTYPIVPDSNLMPDQNYTYGSGNIFREDKVVLARSCKIGKKTVIGRGTSVGDGTEISSSVIGRRCQIGKNVEIKNAYIWDDVVVKDGAKIDHSIIAHEAVIGQNAVVKPGALISFGVIIGDDKMIPGSSRIARVKKVDDSEETVAAETDPVVVGAGGEGYEYTGDLDEEDDPDAPLLNSLIYSTEHLNIDAESISTVHEHDSDDEGGAGQSRSRGNSFAGSISDDEGSGSGDGENFHKDAVADVFKTLSESGDFHNTRVEFTSLRLSNNATDHHIHRAIAVGFTKYIAELIQSGVEPAKAVSQALKREGASSFVADVAIGREKTLDDQVDFFCCLQKDLCHREKGEAVLFALCKQLYDLEIIEEEGFEGWWKDPRSSDGEEMQTVRKMAGGFIEWLAEAEEEDSDEEDDEDEDDNDSD